MDTETAQVHLERADTYLDAVEQAVNSLPESYYCYNVNAAFLTEKERRLEEILNGTLSEAFSAVAAAHGAGVAAAALTRLLERAHTLRGRVWIAMSCTPFGLTLRSGPQVARGTQADLREGYLQQAEDDLRKAIAYCDASVSDAMPFLMDVLLEQQRFDESAAVLQLLIDAAPDSGMAREAQQLQRDIQEVRKQYEHERA